MELLDQAGLAYLRGKQTWTEMLRITCGRKMRRSLLVIPENGIKTPKIDM